MLMYTRFLFIIFHLNFIFADDSIISTQVYVLPKVDEPFSIYTKSFPLIDSDCFCSYDHLNNLLLCSPLSQTSLSYPLSSTNISIINVTLNDCTFSNNHLSLPIINNQTIDYLRLYDINHQDYLVFDTTSFSSYSINHLYIIYSYIQPITMLLLSNRTLPSSLQTLYIDSCYLITLNKPLNRLYLLQSITFINIHQFSWYDFQQQIIYLPKLQYILIENEIFSTKNDIFNVLSCTDISPKWILTYHSIQTCSCKFMKFLKTIRRFGNLYKCFNSDNTIDFINHICQYHGKEYQISNQTNLFCNQCLSISCPNGTACGEIYDSQADCILLSRYDYNTIFHRIPLTPYTKQYLFRESQEYLFINSNKTLEPNGFNSVVTMLIDLNLNHTDNSLSDVQMFHQTFAEMLNRPWSPQIFSTVSSSKPAVWQELLISLDELIRSINNSETKFEFQSQSISTISLSFPQDQQTKDSFGWKITNDNKIISNITTMESTNQNITTRVFLQFNYDNQSNCVPSNTQMNCTNRFSITSLKSPKLFYNTNRVPEYDVISIIAPNSSQQVTFYFDQKLSLTNTNEYIINTTKNSTSDSFYDQLDLMISEGICMYLNITNMLWQTDGCFTDRQYSNSTSVRCTCEHLTMFTVFFSLTCATPSKALDILSWIGCILSILGLSVTLIMSIVISQYRRIKNSKNAISLSHSSSSQELRRRIMSKPRRLSMVKSMLFVLCILLILMNIFILILTFIKSGRNLSCTIFSALLYYFTLTAFLWKFFFAFQQSLFLTNFFQTYWSTRRLFFIYLFLAFSLPICPLLIMFIKYENSTFISSTCNYCWLTREFLLYGLIIPIIVILCLNFIFYFYTMIHLCLKNRQQSGLRSTKSDHSRLIQNIKIGIFFAIIMGLSWILGFLVLIPNSYVQLFGNILFCIINTLQGFAFSIMVFCMLERKSFRKCFCFWKYKNSIKKTRMNQLNNLPQQLEITSNDENETKKKTSFNSSIYTSTTSNGGESNNQEITEQYKNKILPIRKEENQEEHISSTLAF